MLLERQVKDLTEQIDNMPMREPSIAQIRDSVSKDGGKYDEFIMEEMKRLNAKMVADSTEFD